MFVSELSAAKLLKSVLVENLKTNFSSLLFDYIQNILVPTAIAYIAPHDGVVMFNELMKEQLNIFKKGEIRIAGILAENTGINDYVKNLYIGDTHIDIK